jgi:HEAT repeat protein
VIDRAARRRHNPVCGPSPEPERAMNRRLLLLSASVVLLPLLAAAADPPPGAAEGEPSWSERFPEVAVRIRHFDGRMASADPKVRLRVLTELTYFRPRDSRVYPPFFRALLKDPSPEVRWQAVNILWNHNIFLDEKELPRSFTEPLVGALDRDNADDVKKFRAAARGTGPVAGWAIHALGIIGDKESIPIARECLADDNVFTRFSAAMALIQLGEAKAGREALKKMAAAPDLNDKSGFYRMRVDECLYRLGDTDAAADLIAMLESGVRESYADDPADVLEDLTGQWFAAPAEWRKWWDGRKK